MAGEAVENLAEQVTPEDLKSPGDDDSLANIMEKVQHPVFVGHPADTEPEKEVSPEGGTPPEPEKEGGTPPEPEPEPAQEKKYKSWEEAEAGAREHQASFSKKAEEAARERGAKEAAERELEELRQKLAEREKPPPEPTKTLEEIETEQENKIVQALEEIGQLDEFDPDYKKKVAKAWRKAGIGGAGQPDIPGENALDELIERRVQAVFESREADRQKQESQTADERIRTNAEDLAGKGGLNMQSGSADHTLFWAMANKMPQEFDDKPLEEQVRWTVNEVRRMKGEVVLSKEEMDARARAAQTNNAVLGRGAERPKSSAKTQETYTLGSIMNQHLERRRI